MLADEIRKLILSKFGKNIPITIDNSSDTAYTDGKRIVLITTVNGATDADKLDIILAMAFHEAAHCLYTDFEYISEKNMGSNPLVQHIHNILEDEEIENRMTKQCIGYGKFFAKLKAGFLEENVAGADAVKGEKVNQLDEIMTILFCLVRYPKFIHLIDNALLDKYESLFIKINDILTNNECPAVVPATECTMKESRYYDGINITRSTGQATFDIYKYLTDYLLEDFADEMKKYSEGDTFMDKIEDMAGIPIPSSTAEVSKEKGNALKEMPVFRHDDENMGSSTPDADNVDLRNTVVRSGNPERYNKMYHEMLPYMKDAEKIIIRNNFEKKDKLETHRFRRNGSLDTNRLADAMQNINTVYQQKMTIKEKVKNAAKYAFVIMIDESGSMLARDHRETFGARLSVMFYELFSKYSDIELYVYGHGDYINPYITKESKNKYVLGNTDLQGGQDDATAYRKIISDVRRQTNLPIVILNVTDFYYCCADDDLARTIDEFKRTGVSFNMICIGNKHTPREEHICQTILEGQVLYLKRADDSMAIADVIRNLADMIKKNYDRFSK